MKVISAAALSLATLAPFAAAAGYTATWTQEGDKCDGAIILGEYTASESCTEVDCAVIPGVTGQGARTTCVEDHIAGANAVLKDSPYVLVEVYPEGSNCEGNFGVAVAVTANGECIPGTNGQASYNVTMADDNTAVWLQYTTPDCSGEEVRVPFTEEQLNGKTCTAGFLKALGSKPAAAGGDSNSTDAPAKSGYTAKWTVEGDKCDGSIWLGEYTKTDTCTAVDCAPIEGVTTAGAKTTCVEDHIEGAAAVLKDVPYVLVEVYEEKSECKGDFGIAIAVTANGVCIPGTDGKASYNVTMGADNSALWLQYATADCSGDEVRVAFPEAELKGEACTAGFLKAWAIKPASAGGNDTSATETPVPTTTESGAAATSLVGAAALSVAAVFSASLL